MATTTAGNVVTGDQITDQYGQSYTVTRVDHNHCPADGVYFWKDGQGYPEFYSTTSPVTIEGLKAPAKAPTAPVLSDLARTYIAQAEADLRKVRQYGDDGQWRYMKWVTPEGRTYSREYRTQKGFNESYLREARKGSDILIAE